MRIVDNHTTNAAKRDDEYRSKNRGNETQATGNKNAVRFAGFATDDPSSESEGENYLPLSQKRQYLKPPTFNGSTNFETFYAHFENCAKFNHWSHVEQLAHLRNSLKDEAGQVLWDSELNVTNSLSKLTKLLKDRFGGAAQSDKFKMELRSRLRQPRESLADLYRDIKRLMALGYPELDAKAREVIAVDRFIDSLGDADLALKIRERTPTTLDEALRAGLKQEVWNKDAARLRTDENGKPKTVRAAGDDPMNVVIQKIDQLQRQVDQVSRRQFQTGSPSKISRIPVAASASPGPTYAAPPTSGAASTTPAADGKFAGGAADTIAGAAAKSPAPPKSGTRTNRRPGTRTAGVCWTCGGTGHRQADCPSPPTGEGDRPTQTMPIRECGGTMHKTSNVYLSGHIKSRIINVLLDTGSDVSLAPYDLIEKHKCRLRKSTTAAIKAANGSDVIIDGEATLPLRVADRLFHTVVLVSKDISETILGIDWLRKHECEWDFINERVRFGAGEWIQLTGKNHNTCRRIYADKDVVLEPNRMQMISARATLTNIRRVPSTATVEPHQFRKGVYIGRTLVPPEHDKAQVCMMNTTLQPILITAGTSLGQLQPADLLEDADRVSAPADPPTQPPAGAPTRPSTGPPTQTPAGSPTVSPPTKTSSEDSVIPKLMDSLPDELDAEQRGAARRLLYDYEDVFSKNEYDIGRTPLVECHIDTGTSRPIRQPLRRQPLKHMDVIDEHVDEMLRHGVIEPAASPWASNVVLVSKKDGSLRFCVDYRAVNAVTYKDSYPLPLIDNCINAMSGSTWFSTLDLRAGYHNIPVAAQDRDKTAFVTRRGCWRYTVMPFGLTCSPSVFQRLMDMVLHGLSYEICLVYLDDIIIFSSTFEEQLRRLGAVLQRLRWAKLKLKPSKCKLLQRKVEFLGHTISKAGVEMQTSKVDAVVNWPRPRDIHQLRSFMGLCGYYRRFIAGFADTAAPLHALTGKGVHFSWGPEQETAFVALKEKLTTAPVLGMPENAGQYVLDSDASDVGLGAVLSQVQDGEERVIAYASRTLQKPERNYETTKKELLAVVYGLKQFRQYLLGRPIIIRVDHAALGWLKRTAEPLPQLARWLTFIECFDYQIIHRAGKKHVNADTMSRRPAPLPDEETEARGEESRAVRVLNVLEQPTADAADQGAGTTTRPPVGSPTRPPTQPPTQPPARPPAGPPTKPPAGTPASSSSTQATGVAGATPPSTTNGSPPATLPRSTPTSSSDLSDLAAAQLEDDDLRELLVRRQESQKQPAIGELLTTSEYTKKLWSQWYRLHVQNGVLCRLFEDRRTHTTVYQALIPYRLREAAIRNCHVGMAGGHLGVKKTLDQIQRRFYWSTWRSDTFRHCRRCPECCAYHRGQLPRSAPLQPIIAGAPFERLSIDLTGPHTRSRRGHVYILTCIDPFTKWVEAFPIRNKEAETVAKVLVDQVFCRFGVPIALLSDQGKEVDGKVMHEICRLLDIDKLHTSPYKPSTNSALERFHRSLNSMLGKVVKESQTDWDERLPFVMAAYRASRHESTGYSPNALTLGRETRAPVDAVLNLPTAEAPADTYDEYVERLQGRLRGAYALVRKELGRAAERNKKYYDLRVRPRRYAVGEWVYYYNPRHYRGRQDKWSRKFSGPHLITAVPSAVNVTIQRSRRARPFTVHIDKVKPYLSDPPPSWIQIPPPDNATNAAPPTAVGALPPVPVTPTGPPTRSPTRSPTGSPTRPPAGSPTGSPPKSPMGSPPVSSTGTAGDDAADEDDTVLYDAGRPKDSDETIPKRVDSDADDESTPAQAEHYAVNESPLRARRPAREHRLPARYRD